MERLLIAIGEQDERYDSERYRDQRSEGGAKIGFPIVGCLVVRHRRDLPIIRTLSPTPPQDRGSCEGGNEAQSSPSADASAVAALL